MHIDYLLGERVRLSGNYLFDEFVIDEVQKEKNKEHGKAYSVRFAYTPIFSNKLILTAYSSIVHVGTPTFRHGTGTNNFVQQGSPLGWHGGSDGQEICIGFNVYNRNNIIASIKSGYLQSGGRKYYI
jgi:hypothetical protein